MDKVFIERLGRTIDFKVIGIHKINDENETTTAVPILEVGLSEELKFLLCINLDTVYYRFLSGYEDRQYEDGWLNRVLDEETLIRYFLPNEDGVPCDVFCNFSSAMALGIYRDVNINSKLGMILSSVYNFCLAKIDWKREDNQSDRDKNDYVLQIADKYTEEIFTIGIAGFYKTDLEKLPVYVIDTGTDVYIVCTGVYIWETLCYKVDRQINEFLLYKNLEEVMTMSNLDEKSGYFSVSVLNSNDEYEKQLFQPKGCLYKDSKFAKTAKRVITEFNNRIKENEIEQIFNAGRTY